MQPPRVAALVNNFAADPQYVCQLLQQTGYVVLPPEVSCSDAALRNSLLQLISAGKQPLAVVKRDVVESGGGQVEVPVVYIATGFVSVYQVTDAAGTRSVPVPQVIKHPNTCLSTAVLEQCLAAAYAAGGTA